MSFVAHNVTKDEVRGIFVDLLKDLGSVPETELQPFLTKAQRRLSFAPRFLGSESGILLDAQSYQVFSNDGGPRKIDVTYTEFNLLRYLMTNFGIICSYEDILRNVWGYTNFDDKDMKIMKPQISRLRKKLGEYGQYIENREKIGYTFTGPMNVHGGVSEGIQLGGLLFDADNRALYNMGKKVHLTSIEFGILRTLVEHRGQVVPYRLLTQEMSYSWSWVRHHISNLRQKIEDDPRKPKYIIARKGGYKLTT